MYNIIFENRFRNILIFEVVVTGLLESCQNYVVSKQSNLTHWHPVLGWFAQPVDAALHAAMQHVKVQLHLLWNSQVIAILLGNYLYHRKAKILGF